jgi:hypothetical protein
MKVAESTRLLHKKDLKACHKAALKQGWPSDLVAQVENLEWSVKSLQENGKRIGAKQNQIAVLVDLHHAAKLEFMSFAVKSITG